MYVNTLDDKFPVRTSKERYAQIDVIYELRKQTAHRQGTVPKMAARRLTWKGCRDTCSENYFYTLSYSLDIVWYHVFHTSVHIKHVPH
jgi:hypothetical protein